MQSEARLDIVLENSQNLRLIFKINKAGISVTFVFIPAYTCKGKQTGKYTKGTIKKIIEVSLT